MATITELKRAKAALLDGAKAIQTAASEMNRELTAEEFEKIEAKISEAKTFDAQIEAAEKRASVLAALDNEHKNLSAPVVAQIERQAAAASVKPRWEDDPAKGFRTERDFYMAVMKAGKGGQVPENLEYLRIRAAVGSDEQGTYSDPYGNFLVPTAFSPEMLTTPAEGDPIGALTRKVPMQAPIVEIPARVDKDHSSSVSGGLRVYRRAEADTVTASRMQFERVALHANALMGISYTTEELINDSPMSVVALLGNGFRDEFAGKINAERIRGSGAGEYLGALNSPCLISVSKETGQVASSIVGANVLKMRKRIYNFSTSVWVANHDTYDQLAGVHIAGTNGDVFLFQPARGEDVPDMLLGRPIYFIEDCSTLGTVGDLMLCNWGEYLEATYQPLESAESIHVRFVNHERAFKFHMRNDGAPWWRTTLTPKQGSNTRSPFVALATRS